MDNCPKCRAKIGFLCVQNSGYRVVFECGSYTYLGKPNSFFESSECLRSQLAQCPARTKTEAERELERAHNKFRELLDRCVAQSKGRSDAEAEVRRLRLRLVQRPTTWAYNRVCRALDKAHDDIRKLQTTIADQDVDIERLANQNIELEDFVNQLHPRVIKLARSGKRFIVIGVHEPYFIKAYQMIREQELKQGTWLFPDDQEFVDAHKEWIEIQNG